MNKITGLIVWLFNEQIEKLIERKSLFMYTQCEITNYRSEKRIRNNRIRRKRDLQRKFLMFVMTVCLVITSSIGVNGFMSNAKDKHSKISYKYYTSITVGREDTLWSIAGEYMDEDHYDSLNDYIEEVRQINHLANDIITYGGHLIVPYYMEEYIE